jgi:hypothetical protein
MKAMMPMVFGISESSSVVIAIIAIKHKHRRHKTEGRAARDLLCLSWVGFVSMFHSPVLFYFF